MEEEKPKEAKVFKKDLKGQPYEGEKIEVETSKGKVTVGQIDYGDDKEASRRCLKQVFNAEKNTFIGKYDQVEATEYQVLFSILESPFPLEIEKLRRLSFKDGTTIENAFVKLNLVSKKEGE